MRIVVLFFTLMISFILSANNVITYSATQKLSEVTYNLSSGVHTNAFNVPILEHTFANGHGIITFNGDVLEIGAYAFYSCSLMDTISLPEGVICIGSNAFTYCSALKVISIPNSVRVIDAESFDGCVSLLKIDIPDSTQYIGMYAFRGCKSLPVEEKLRYAGNYLVEAIDKSCDKYIIRDGTKWIGTSAFANCDSIISFDIPNGIISIGLWAFQSCDKLSSITIPNSVTEISFGAFDLCRNLPIKDNIRYADTYLVEAVDETLSFYNIKEGTIWIGSEAFRGCDYLKSVNLPNSLRIIGEMAFYFSHIDTIIIPNNVTKIENDAFYGSNLKHIHLSDSLSIIGDNCFGYSWLDSIKLPNSLTNIGSGAFSNCQYLAKITSEALLPPVCKSGCFKKVDKQIPILVHANSINAYQTAEEWKSFINIEGLEPKHLVTVYSENGTIVGDGMKYETTTDTLIAVPDYGYHFSHWDDGTNENPRLAVITQDTTFEALFAKDTFSITTSAHFSERGRTLGDTSALFLDTIQISAIANYGYYFARWDDGNTNNPRTIIVTEDKNYQANFEPNQYQLTASTNGHGSVTGCGTYEYLSNVNMSVSADFGYHFVQWNDGNKDNPRSLAITCDTAFVAIIAKTYSGECGNNLYWAYSNHALTITGSGSMYSYASTTVPWELFLDSITSISLPAGCTSLGNNCFQDIAGIKEITIPASVTTIGANAFAGCRKLYDIYCYAAEPPVAQSSSFENYNVYLHIPCDNKRDYEMDAVFGTFKYIQCMGAEPVVTNVVTVEPTATDVALTWPAEEEAATYNIKITKGGIVFCTLIFDADGRLTSIAFAAPARGAAAQQTAATATGTGFSFTVTGLQPDTHYDYTIDVQNSSEQSIKTHTGAFDTESVTAVNNVNDNDNNHNKLLRNGILLIERNGVYYNAQGAVVE